MNEQRGNPLFFYAHVAQRQHSCFKSKLVHEFVCYLHLIIAPGFMPYAEISFYDLEVGNKSTTLAEAAKQENEGTVFLADTKLMF